MSIQESNNRLHYFIKLEDFDNFMLYSQKVGAYLKDSSPEMFDVYSKFLKFITLKESDDYRKLVLQARERTATLIERFKDDDEINFKYHSVFKGERAAKKIRTRPITTEEMFEDSLIEREWKPTDEIRIEYSFEEMAKQLMFDLTMFMDENKGRKIKKVQFFKHTIKRMIEYINDNFNTRQKKEYYPFRAGVVVAHIAQIFGYDIDGSSPPIIKKDYHNKVHTYMIPLKQNP
jgi:hypothetical protein